MSEELEFNNRELILLRRLAGAIIGASDEFQIPGADDDIIFNRLLERAAPAAVKLRISMADFFEQFGGVASVAMLDDEDFGQMTVEIQRKRHSFSSSIMTLVAQSYYEDPRVLLSLGKEARPPFPEGNHLEQGDWSLLDEVKKRKPMYRDC